MRVAPPELSPSRRRPNLVLIGIVAAVVVLAIVVLAMNLGR